MAELTLIVDMVSVLGCASVGGVPGQSVRATRPVGLSPGRTGGGTRGA